MGKKAEQNLVLVLKCLCVIFGCMIYLYCMVVLPSIILSTFELLTTKDGTFEGESAAKQPNDVLKNIDYAVKTGDLGRNKRDVNKKFDQDLESQLNYVPANRKTLQPIKEPLNGIDKVKQPAKVVPVIKEPLNEIDKVQPLAKVVPVKVVEPSKVVDNKESVIYKLNSDLESIYANAPKTFNEDYIRYFWEHPELYLRYEYMRNELINKGDTKQKHNDKVDVGVDDKIDKVKPSINKKTKAGTRNSKSDKRQAYITVSSPKGQLGNQMFQLATLIGTAEVNNLIPIVPTKDFMTNIVFETNSQLYDNIDTNNFVTITDDNQTIKTIKKKLHKLDTHTNWTLDGYFQSWLYFKEKDQEVRRLFQIKDVYRRQAEEFIAKNVPSHTIKVGIHIRRQDFISSYQTKLGRVPVTAEYVRNAQKYFEDKYVNVVFIVVSDDIRWCKDNINGSNVIYSTSSLMGTDLAILTECNHVIISVGTFGWWGGWLSGGTVIYYKNYPRPGSYLDKIFDVPSYYPSDWIPME